MTDAAAARGVGLLLWCFGRRGPGEGGREAAAAIAHGALHNGVVRPRRLGSGQLGVVDLASAVRKCLPLVFWLGDCLCESLSYVIYACTGKLTAGRFVFDAPGKGRAHGATGVLCGIGQLDKAIRP